MVKGDALRVTIWLFLVFLIFFLVSPAAHADVTIANGETVALADGEEISIDGDLTIISGGTFDAGPQAQGQYTPFADSVTITLSGDWLNSGTFSAGLSTITFTGSATITGNNTFYNLSSSTAPSRASTTCSNTKNND